MSASREPFARFLARMEELGFRPSRRLGQNFLLDPSLHRAIADAAGIARDDLVLEVGAGLGFLTRELAARAARVIAVEIDPRLQTILAEQLPEFPDGGRGVTLIRGDVLLGDDRLHAEVGAAIASGGSRLIVVANLPYAISGPFLAALPGLERPPDRVVVLVQKELAERLVARPGSGAFGSLSAVLGCGFDARLLRSVGREVFRPRPKVDSALVALERRAGSPFWDLPQEARRELARFVRALFSARRKKLRSALPVAWSLLGWREGPEPDPDLADRRPEELAASDCLALFLRQRPHF